MDLNYSSEEILKDPKFFRCENWNAILKKTVCVTRHTIGIIESKTDLVPRIPHRCEECEQGDKILAEVGDQVEGVCPICQKFPAREQFDGLCGHCHRNWRTRKAWKDNKKANGELTREDKLKADRENKQADKRGKTPDTILQEARVRLDTEESDRQELEDELTIGKDDDNPEIFGIYREGGRTVLKLDITDYDEEGLLEYLREAGRIDIRSPAHQALFIIVKALKDIEPHWNHLNNKKE